MCKFLRSFLFVSFSFFLIRSSLSEAQLCQALQVSLNNDGNYETTNSSIAFIITSQNPVNLQFKWLVNSPYTSKSIICSCDLSNSIEVVHLPYGFSIDPIPTIVWPNFGKATFYDYITLSVIPDISGEYALTFYAPTNFKSCDWKANDASTAITCNPNPKIDVTFFVYQLYGSETSLQDFTYTTRQSRRSKPAGIRNKRVSSVSSKYENILRFSVPENESPESFKIYRDAALTQLVAIIPNDGSKKYKYIDKNIESKRKNSYFIFADYGGYRASPAVRAERKKKCVNH